MRGLIKATLPFTVCLCLASCQAPSRPTSSGALNTATAPSPEAHNSESKGDDLFPVIPRSIAQVGDALVIVVPPLESVHQPAGALLDARNEWAKALHSAFEKRASFGSVILAQEDTSNTVQRVVSVSTNASLLLLVDIPTKSVADSTWMFMRNDWFGDMRAVNGGPATVWGKFDGLKVPFGRKADLMLWIERVEFLAKLSSFNHALAFSLIQQKPKKTGKYRVFQSLPGYSLCDQGRAMDDLFCVEGLGRPFVADNTWFDDKTLVWCGTFTYDTKGGLTRTVERYALDLNTAISSLLQQTETRR